MTTKNYLDILKSHDNSNDPEIEDAFDWPDTQTRLNRFKTRLSEAFKIHFESTSESMFQDCSHFAEILVPQTLRADEDEQIGCTIRFSRFGRMVTIPGEGLIVKGAAKTIISLLGECGYVFIPEAILDTPYKGKFGGIRDWFTRYFDYQ